MKHRRKSLKLGRKRCLLCCSENFKIFIKSTKTGIILIVYCVQNKTLIDELNKEREESAKARQSNVQLNIELSRLQVINYCANSLLRHLLQILFATVGYMCACCCCSTV
jgi:hypothetical protein